MSRPAIMNTITRKAGRQILLAQKHSPVILFSVGMVGVVTTVVLASKATLHLEEVLNEAEHKREQIDEALEVGGDKYDEEKAHKDGIVVRTQTALKIAKLYAPAALSGLVTVSAFTGSHVILNRRYVAMSAAYAAVDTGFKEYRKRVVSELGEEKDREFRAGVLLKEMAVDTDEGVSVKTVKTIPPMNGEYSIYARCFDESNKLWQPMQGMNLARITAAEQYFNNLLRYRGHVFLNEVYDVLGFERTKAGQLVGWVRGNKNGDSYIDLGIAKTYEGMRFVNGDERSVWIDPNVDGNVLDLM